MKAIISIVGLIIFSLFLISCDGETTTGDSGNTKNNNSNTSNGEDKKEELYSVYGKAIDMSENPISGVTISISGQNTDKSTTTDNNGYYIFINLIKGKYMLVAEKTGYVSVFNYGKLDIYLDVNDTGGLEANFLFYKKEAQKNEIILDAIEDTYIDERHPNDNFGSSDHLMTGYEDLTNAPGNPQSGYIYNKYTLIRFSVSTIPSNANILSATLMLSIHYPSTNHSSSNVIVSMIEKCPLGNWSEKEATIIDIPTSLTFLDLQNIESNKPGHVYYWDVNEAIKKWVNESISNYGFRVHSFNNESIHDDCNFSSREYSGGPRIRVVYEIEY